jgi:DNA-binding response OmpR family regulator
MTQLGLGIVEPDTVFGRQLVGFFGEHGFTAELHGEASLLLDHLPSRPPRMVVLGDGGGMGNALQVLRRIREVSLVPCVLLSGKADDVSEIVVLEAGADDLIDRAVPLRALLARIRAVLRRAEWGAVETVPAVAVNGWRLVPLRRQLLRPDGSECLLTTAEFDLMRLLVDAQGRALTRDDIALGVFRRPFRAEDRTVDNLVLRLRRKLGPKQQYSIKTVRGAGYMFAGFSESGRRVA